MLSTILSLVKSGGFLRGLDVLLTQRVSLPTFAKNVRLENPFIACSSSLPAISAFFLLYCIGEMLIGSFPHISSL